jgi:hypothetical protein
MPAVRYLALAALVVWLGLTVAALGGELDGLHGRFHAVSAACGAAVLVALFVMKFVGPPPRAFVVRAALAFAMLTATVYGWAMPPHLPAALLATAALGFILLSWYANE